MLDALRVRPMWVLGLLAAFACTVGDGTENASSFGTGTMTTASTTMSSSSASSSPMEDDDTEAASDPSSGETESTTEAPETSGVTSTGTGEATSAETGTEQPQDGMYSPCEQVTECVGLTSCQSGFCTRGCADPAVDCDPSPGGTATPICFMFETQMLCALGCDGGETCPSPMTCTPMGAGSVCV